MKRSWLLSWGYAAGLGLLIPACVGKEVSVGGEAGEGLDRCVGSSDGCLATVRAQPADETSTGSCGEDQALQLELDFSFDVQNRLCPRPATGCGTAPDGSIVQLCPIDIRNTCSARVQRGLPAPDGSLWLVITKQGVSEQLKTTMSLWLGHVGSDGSDLGFVELARGTELRGNTVFYEADLAVDAESRAHLIVNSNDPGPDADSEIRDHTWLARYDSEENLVDGAWDLPGLARSFLALGTDGRVAVAGNAANLEKRAIAALLEPDGDLIWSQPKLPSTGARDLGIMGLGVDGADNVFVYTLRSQRKNEFGLLMFDASGKRMWDRTFTGTFEGQVAYERCIVADRDGNVTISGQPPVADPNQPLTFDDAKLVSLNASGDTRWTLEISRAQQGMSLDPETGAIYLSGQKGPVRVSADGECSSLLWPKEPDATGQIEPGPDGHLYFFGWKVGRYKALAQP